MEKRKRERVTERKETEQWKRERRTMARRASKGESKDNGHERLGQKRIAETARKKGRKNNSTLHALHPGHLFNQLVLHHAPCGRRGKAWLQPRAQADCSHTV